MNNEEIFKKVRKVISDQLGMDEDKIAFESSFLDDLGADSLDMVELIMSLQEIYKIEISDEDAEKMNTVSDVVNYIEKNTNK